MQEHLSDARVLNKYVAYSMNNTLIERGIIISKLTDVINFVMTTFWDLKSGSRQLIFC